MILVIPAFLLIVTLFFSGILSLPRVMKLWFFAYCTNDIVKRIMLVYFGMDDLGRFIIAGIPYLIVAVILTRIAIRTRMKGFGSNIADRVFFLFCLQTLLYIAFNGLNFFVKIVLIQQVFLVYMIFFIGKYIGQNFNPDQLRSVMKFFVYFYGITVLIGIIQFKVGLFPFDRVYFHQYITRGNAFLLQGGSEARVLSTFSSPFAFGYTGFFALCCAMYLFRAREKRMVRQMIVSVVGILLSIVRSVWLALVLGGVFVLSSMRKKAGFAVAVSALVVAYTFIGFGEMSLSGGGELLNVSNPFLERSTTIGTYYNRAEAWLHFIEYPDYRPLIGKGVGRSSTDQVFDINANDIIAPRHSQFLTLFYEEGLFGVLFFYFAALFIVIKYVSTHDFKANAGQYWLLSYPVGLLYVSFATAEIIEPFFFLLLGYFSAQIYRRKLDNPSSKFVERP